jgi:hypothetical protein
LLFHAEPSSRADPIDHQIEHRVTVGREFSAEAGSGSVRSWNHDASPAPGERAAHGLSAFPVRAPNPRYPGLSERSFGLGPDGPELYGGGPEPCPSR